MASCIKLTSEEMKSNLIVMLSGDVRKIEGFDPELTKDLKLTDQFHHLYNHTEFAITDFIYVRKFRTEINIEITK